MGRSLITTAITSNTFNVPTTTGTKVIGAGYMGEFGTGLWQVFYVNGTFTVPAGITSIRVRVIGGGGGASGGGSSGGGGGGYAHGVFTVSPGANYTVTVGAKGTATPTSGGTSSFGALISATGGVGANVITGNAGGSGSGGDFQANGGSSGAVAASAGGASGSQLGKGGSTFTGVSGGAGVGNGNTLVLNSGGGSAFGSALSVTKGAPDITGAEAIDAAGKINTINAVIRFPFDCFVGGGGAPSVNVNIAGSGGGAGYAVGTSFAGAGGGAASGGSGSIAGLGGGAAGASSSVAGNGIVIVEF